jgi:hypothetical protein
MTDLSKARSDLREWLADMEMLSKLADVANSEHQPFVEAFTVARQRALAAAAAYAEVAKRG